MLVGLFRLRSEGMGMVGLGRLLWKQVDTGSSKSWFFQFTDIFQLWEGYPLAPARLGC